MCCGNRGESGDDDDGPISPNRIESRSRRREANLGSSSAAAGNGAIQIHAWPSSHLCHARTHEMLDRTRLRSILGGETAPPFSPLIGMWRKGRREEGPYRAIASSAPHQSIRPHLPASLNTSCLLLFPSWLLAIELAPLQKGKRNE